MITPEDSPDSDLGQVEKWGVAVYRDLYAKTPNTKHLTLEGLARSLCRVPRVADDKKHLPLWSPGLLREGETRCSAAVAEVSCLVLDLDHQPGLVEVVERTCEVWGGVDFLYHTTWSHRQEEAAIRVVIPFKSPCPAPRFRDVWAWAADQDPRLDRHCKDLSRIYFVPGVPSNASWCWGAWAAEGRAEYSAEAPLVALPQGFGQNLLDWQGLPIREVAPVKEYKPITLMPGWGAVRELQRRLKEDPSARDALAKELGASIRSTYICGVECPNCGRPEVWWWRSPGLYNGWQCRHRNSCGAWGWLDQFVDTEALTSGVANEYR